MHQLFTQSLDSCCLQTLFLRGLEPAAWGILLGSKSQEEWPQKSGLELGKPVEMKTNPFSFCHVGMKNVSCIFIYRTAFQEQFINQFCSIAEQKTFATELDSCRPFFPLSFLLLGGRNLLKGSLDSEKNIEKVFNMHLKYMCDAERQILWAAGKDGMVNPFHTEAYPSMWRCKVPFFWSDWHLGGVSQGLVTDFSWKEADDHFG